jgi:alcohol dehydrogenase class IV
VALCAANTLPRRLAARVASVPIVATGPSHVASDRVHVARDRLHVARIQVHIARQVHALAYPIGSHFHVPHGLSNALMLPHVLAFNAAVPSAARQYASLAPLIFPPSAARPASPTASPERDLEAALGLAEGFRQLAVELGIPTRLTAVGIAEKDVELLASESMKQTRLLPNNPREVTLADARRLYMQAL